MNRETKLGMYIVGGIVLMLGVLTYGAFLFFTQTVPYLDRAKAPKSDGSANTNLFVEGPFVRDYAASANLELPPVPPQRDSPSVQLGFFDAHGDIQGGLIRSPDDKFHLRAFVAYSAGRPQNTLRYFGRLKDGPHAVELRVRNDEVTFLVDGRRLFSAPRAAYVPPDSNPWLTLGTAVRYKGGSASGSISDIRVQRDGDNALTRYDPVCVGSSGGLRTLRYGGRYVLAGTNIGSPALNEGCRDAYARHSELATQAR